jgi:anti-sigma28 factor (negative regulator of flagellin synthesis)
MDVGMRDTTRHINHRRPSVSAPRAATAVIMQPATTRAGRVDRLRRLVAAGQYQVNARAVAHQIMFVAGVPALEE